jgi:exopolysaccharide biosynthesis polyprenyl glycosylphosphotransferase
VVTSDSTTPQYVSDRLGLARGGKGSSAHGGPSRPVRRGWIVRRALLIADVVGLVVAFLAAELLFGKHHGGVGVPLKSLIFVALLPLWVVVAKLYGLYDRDEERATHSTADDTTSVFHLVTVGVWVFYATSWFVGLAHPSQVKLASFWLLALVLMISGRSVARALARRHPAYIQNVLIVGAGDVGQLVARKVVQHPEYRINLVGLVDSSPKHLRTDLRDVKVLTGEIEALVAANAVDRVIFAFSNEPEEELVREVRALRNSDVQIDVVPRLFDAVGPNCAIHGIEGLPLMSVAPVRIGRSSRMLKRLMDVVAASAMLIVSAPLFAIIAVFVKRDSPGPIFFRQTRLGLNMSPFTVLKFRTMRIDTSDTAHRDYVKQIMTPDAAPIGGNLYKLDRSAEVTRVGRWLRRTSLDEMPQLLNVLRGDMSLVGPRPALPYEIELYAPHHFERFAVPAGMTGLWQVEARAHSTLREALDLDVAYARGWSLGLDLRLLLRTPLLMFRGGETR